MANDIGVITEQGYPTGVGLGFSPLTEAEQEKIKKEEETHNETDR